MYYNKKTIVIFTAIAVVIGLLITVAIMIWIPEALWVRILGAIIAFAISTFAGAGLGIVIGGINKPKKEGGK